MGFFVGVLKLKVAKPQKVFQFVSNLQKKGAKLSLNRWIVLWGVIWYRFFGDLSQSEKLCEIKPPLV